jgi:uncharacterized membrane protein
MPWQIAVLFRALIAYAIQPTFMKKAADLPSPTRRLAWMFAWAFGYALVGMAVMREVPQFSHAWVAVLGVLNSVALYCHWKAMKISLSKSAIFAQADDIVAIGCAMLFLGETRFITWQVGLGILLCLAAVWFFAVRNDRKGLEGDKVDRTNLLMIGWILAYSVLWGFDIFVSRIAGIEGVSLPEYTFWRYGSSLIGALLILLVRGKEEAGAPLTRKGVLGTAGLGLFAWSSILFEYYVLQQAPIAVAQPIFQVSELLFPPLAGWIIFKERKTFRGAEWVGFGLGLMGSLVIALSY